MIKKFTPKLPDSIRQLSSFRVKRLCELLLLLESTNQIFGVLLGGSLSYKNDVAKSDIDLFCLVESSDAFEKDLNQGLYRLKDLDTVIFQGNFPWTEKLYTLFYKSDLDFSVDLCLINSTNSKTFFWEPDGYIIFDKQDIINKCRQERMQTSDYTRQPFLKLNPFSLAIITLKKIEKNLSRNHLWNALEMLNILRRYVMQVIRLNVVKDEYFLGRVDRDIEDVIPPEINAKLSETIAAYEIKDIAKKAILVVEIFGALKEELKKGNEGEYHDWVLNQLEHEKNKLLTYTD